MIPKRIDRKPEIRDDYANLGHYIAAAKEKGEKLDKFWIVGCDAGTDLADLDTALIEIEATRAQKPDVADKTYHLVLSFHAGEEDKLTLEQLQDIERNFAEALGFGDHQRVAGTHINTDNFHMHVAFNKVHPVTGRVHTPYRDFDTLTKMARTMEKKYGLVADKGMDEGKNPVSRKARDYEAKTWQQSFERHLLGHKAEIMAGINTATTWAKLHKGLEPYGIHLRKRGAGLVFAQADGKGRIKASTLDRSCSLAKLESRLGPYLPPPDKQPEKPAKKAYQAKPMTTHPGQDRLWRTYAQTRKPGFLGRALHIRNWKDYLLAEAHKDALALAIVLTYKELLHALDEATTRRHRPYQPPKIATPALKSWFPSGEIPSDVTPFRDTHGNIWALRTRDGQGRSTDIGDTAKPGVKASVPERTTAPAQSLDRF